MSGGVERSNGTSENRGKSAMNTGAGANQKLEHPRTFLPAMRRIVPDMIPESHPVRRIEAEYAILAQNCAKQFVPDYSEFLISIGRDLAEYCLALYPVDAEPFLDFVVIRSGSKVPGFGDVTPGQTYVHGLLPEVADERLMELASSLSLKTPRLSEAVSARKGALNIKVYRGAFPVWSSIRETHCVVLAIAPVYASA